jgi:hypothetical protein
MRSVEEKAILLRMLGNAIRGKNGAQWYAISQRLTEGYYVGHDSFILWMVCESKHVSSSSQGSLRFIYNE